MTIVWSDKELMALILDTHLETLLIGLLQRFQFCDNFDFYQEPNLFKFKFSLHELNETGQA